MTAKEVQKTRDKEKLIKSITEWWQVEMETELLKPENLKKPNWRNVIIKHFIGHIGINEYLLCEYYRDKNPDKVVEECLKISNYCMFIADKIMNKNGIQWRKKINIKNKGKDYVS